MNLRFDGLADALGCDPMDSDSGRRDRAKRAASALADVARLTEALRETRAYVQSNMGSFGRMFDAKALDRIDAALQPAPADKAPGSVGLAGCGHVDRPGVCEKCAKETASHA